MASEEDGLFLLELVSSKMSYFEVWAIIKSFKLKTWEIYPADIYPNLLREIKGTEKEIIFKMKTIIWEIQQ